jgi:hypothetical protein
MNCTEEAIYPTPLGRYEVTVLEGKLYVGEDTSHCVYHSRDSIQQELEAGMGRIKYSKQMLEDVAEKDDGWVEFL